MLTNKPLVREQLALRNGRLVTATHTLSSKITSWLNTDV